MRKTKISKIVKESLTEVINDGFGDCVAHLDIVEETLYNIQKLLDKKESKISKKELRSFFKTSQIRVFEINGLINALMFSTKCLDVFEKK